MLNELSLSDLADALDRDDGHHDYECETCSLPLCTHLRLCREHGIEASAETVPGYVAVAGVHVCVEHAALWMGESDPALVVAVPLTADEEAELSDISSRVMSGCDDWYDRRRGQYLLDRQKAAGGDPAKGAA